MNEANQSTQNLRNILEILYFLSGPVVAIATIAVFAVTLLGYRHQKRVDSKASTEDGGSTVAPAIRPREAQQRKASVPLLTGVLRWVLFTILVSGLPMLCAVLTMSVTNRPIGIETLFGRGELLLVAVGITASAVARMWIDPHIGMPHTTQAVALMSLIVLLGCSLFYVRIAFPLGGQALDVHLGAMYSIAVCGMALFVSAACEMLTAAD